MVYKFFYSKVASPDKKSAELTTKLSSLERSAKHIMGSRVKKLKNSSLILVDELHKPIIKKFNKRKVYS